MKNIIDISNLNADFIIIAEFPEINYVLILHNKKNDVEWIAAYGYDKETTSWCQGHYFVSIQGAMRYILSVMQPITWDRLTEITSELLKGNEVELTEEERNYFREV